MAAASALEQGEQIGFIIENQKQHDNNNHEFLTLERNKERGRIYVEGRVKDDVARDLVQVGYCSRSNIVSE